MASHRTVSRSAKIRRELISDLIHVGEDAIQFIGWLKAVAPSHFPQFMAGALQAASDGQMALDLARALSVPLRQARAQDHRRR